MEGSGEDYSESKALVDHNPWLLPPEQKVNKKINWISKKRSESYFDKIVSVVIWHQVQKIWALSKLCLCVSLSVSVFVDLWSVPLTQILRQAQRFLFWKIQVIKRKYHFSFCRMVSCQVSAVQICTGTEIWLIVFRKKCRLMLKFLCSKICIVNYVKKMMI